jgi:TolB protein
MRWLVPFALVLLTGATAGTTSYATSSGKNGKIVFRRYLAKNMNRGVIFTISPSGRNERQVTHPGTEASDDDPAWAPDGSRIAFDRQRGPDTAIYTVGPDGSSLTRVTPRCPPAKPRRCVGDLSPAFSPNGRDIVFTSFDERLKGALKSAIVIGGSDGRNRRDVVPASSRSGLADPQFSPKGDRILFERLNLGRSRPKDARAIFVVNVDGSGIRRITPWNLSAGDPEWSPDAKWILFNSNEHLNKKSQLYVIHPDGTGLKQLTHRRRGTLGASAAFSPDGRWIAC